MNELYDRYKYQPVTCQIHFDDEHVGKCEGRIVTKVSSNFGARMRACEGAWSMCDKNKIWVEIENA